MGHATIAGRPFPRGGFGREDGEGARVRWQASNHEARECG
jgi:hypothetical protein